MGKTGGIPCKVCGWKYNSRREAEKCEQRGRFPVAEKGLVYQLNSTGSIFVLGESYAVEDRTHRNLHYAVGITAFNERKPYVGLAVLTLEGDEVKNPEDAVKIDPKTLENHSGYEFMKELLNTGLTIDKLSHAVAEYMNR